MDSLKRISYQAIAAVLILVFYFNPAAVYAGPEIESDKVLSPYFRVSTAGAQLPLKKTSGLVTVAGVIADVTIKQEYKNEGDKPIEAIYVFPASTRAAVNRMHMKIGERIIEAKIKEKQAARVTYESAKSEGKSAALLEQQRPNVFQMNIANILPGDVITVELGYTELLVPTDGTYEFVYPTVVGPRYSNVPEEQAPASEGWIASPYMKKGEAQPYDFDLQVELFGAIPFKAVTSPSHQVSVSQNEPTSAAVKLVEKAGNKDFVLRYTFQGDKIETGAMLYDGMEENFFLLMLEPPAVPKIEEIPPREYIFVVDVSGSMHGFPLSVAKQLMSDLLTGLRPIDSFNLMTFSGGQAVLAEKSLPATEANIRTALELLGQQRGGGGTELLPALKRALSLPRQDGVSTSIVVVTDGYVSVEREAFEYIRDNLGKANLFPFGIGSSVNRNLIEGMARAGLGEATIVLDFFGSRVAAENFRHYIESPVLTDIRIDYEGASIYDVEPANVPDLFAKRPLNIFGKWGGKKQGTITVTGRTGGNSFSRTIDLSKLVSDTRLHALSYLWARERIATLSDFNRLQHRKDSEEEIIKIGLKYNLLTEFTSFVAVDKVVRNKTNSLDTVKQPLPLPAGVENTAVGGFLGTSPEPGTYLILGFLSMLMAGYALKSGVLQRARE